MRRKCVLCGIYALSIALMFLFVMCLGVTSSAHEIDSKDYQEMKALEDDIISNAQELCQTEDIFIDENTGVNYEKAEKVYIDVFMSGIKTSEKDAIVEWAEQSDYVWIVPVDSSEKSVEVTLHRESADSEFEITSAQINEREVYSDILAEKSHLIDDYIIVGGTDVFRQPVAIGFENNEAKYWIALGTQYDLFEQAPEDSVIEEGVYDYEGILKLINESNKEDHIEWTVFLVIIAIVIISACIIVMRKKKKSI